MREQIAHHALGVAHHAHHALMAVHARIQKALDGGVGLLPSPAKTPPAGPPAWRTSAAVPGLSAATRRPVSAITSSIMRVISRRTSLVHAPARLDARILRVDLAHDVADDRHRGDVVEREQVGAQAVVDVMGVVGDVVGERRDLRFGAGLRPQFQILDLVVGQDRRRHAVLGVAADRRGLARR